LLFAELFALGGEVAVELDAFFGEGALFGFDFVEAAVELSEEMGDVAFGSGHDGFGAVDEASGEAEFGGDGEAGGAAWGACLENVGGGELLLVEAHGGLEDAFGGGAPDFEGHEVGGGDGEGAGGAEEFEDGDAERAAFLGVGGAAEFVEEDERFVGDTAEHEGDLADVGGEAGEGFGDGLVVADVGEDLIEDGEFGGYGGDGDAGLGHEGEEAGGFHGDGFAAGVGACDEECACGAVDGERDGDDFFALGFEDVFEEGVAGFGEVQAAGEFGGDAAELAGEAGLGEGEVEIGDGVDGGADLGGV
jgi:hypothetical protein